MKYLLCLLTLLCSSAWSQEREVAVTIDDVPNVVLCQPDGFKSALLRKIGTLRIPVAIFINEKNVYNNSFENENLAILKDWVTNDNVTAGNHTYSHSNYADTTLAAFQQDIINGEILTARLINQRPRYFRFPFNSLGNDSIAHAAIREFLVDRDYIHTPFTIESEDWAYNALYEDALKNNDVARAQKIGEQYVLQTLRLFHHFETVSNELYGRNIKHIYLCHDNRLNTDYLVQLVTELKKIGYEFVSLDRALQDKVYQSKEYYTGRHGFSWLYRWEKSSNKRKALMRREPIDEKFRIDYEKFVNE